MAGAEEAKTFSSNSNSPKTATCPCRTHDLSFHVGVVEEDTKAVNSNSNAPMMLRKIKPCTTQTHHVDGDEEEPEAHAEAITSHRISEIIKMQTAKTRRSQTLPNNL